MSFDNVEDVYPLTSTQEGLLYHSVTEEGDVYLDQITATLTPLVPGAFNPDHFRERFQEAWRQCVHRHASLRTAFLWDGLDEPLQVVRGEVEIPIEILDWRGLERLDHEWSAFLCRDRARIFALDEAPLMRLTLIRVGPLDKTGDPAAENAGDQEIWRFVWTFHHMILDGWSARHVLGEVQRIYRTIGHGGEADLAAPFAFRDYIAWLAERDHEAAERFWRGKLAGFERPTRLDAFSPAVDKPPDGERRDGKEPDSSQSGRREILRLDAPETRALAIFARSHGLTLASVLQGAWCLLLSRYARERDVITGLTVAGRPPELEGVLEGVGLFINTLPLRAQITGAPLAEWLRDLQKGRFAARRFDWSPLASVQKWSELPAAQSLFDQILVIENHASPENDGSPPPRGSDFELGGLDFLERSHYSLALLAIPGERLECQVVYDGARFEQSHIRQLLRDLGQLFRAFPAHGESPVDRIPWLGEEDRQKLIAWNRTSREFPATKCIHDLIAEAAAANPEKPAALCGGVSISYAELMRRSGELAAELRSLGAKPDEPVALLIERGLDMVVGILGILRSGAAYVPLDESYPADHLRRVLEDSATPILVCRRLGLEKIRGAGSDDALGGIHTLFIDEPDSWPHSGSVRDESRSGQPLTPEHLAYLIYTSGSTGMPKGVAVTHRNLVHSTNARFAVYGEPVDRFLLLSSFAFDSSVAGLFWTLSTGGTLVLPRPGEEQDLEALDRLLHENRVTHTLCLPSLYRLLLEGARLDTLRVAVVAGEACAAEIVRAHFERLPQTRLFNEYGPTEAAVWSSVHELEAGDGAPVPIGRPIANTRLYVLDDTRSPTPIGVAGELYIAGEGVAQGYWRRDGATEAAFVTLDLPGVEGPERAYRTGDLAAFRPDGALCFLGRADSQVKVRGFRIEIEGVEAALRGLGGVEGAAAKTHRVQRGDGKSSGNRLLAWVTLTPDAETGQVTGEELRRRLGEKVPAFMVPDAISILDALPRRPNGKIDYRALTELRPEKQSHSHLAEASSAEARAIEQRIADAWSEVLQVERPGRRDHFFELGGDSILAIQVVSRLRQAGLAAKPRDLAETPILAQLAATLGERTAEAQEAGDAEDMDAPMTGEVALSPIQHWFFQRRMPAAHHWNLPLFLDIDEAVTAESLSLALAACLGHHDQLRARFEKIATGWRQVVEAPDGLEIPLSVLRHASPDSVQRAIESAQASFDLGVAPLLRALLIQGEEPRLLLIAHHLIVDAISWTLLHEDLELALGQLLRGEKIILPPRSASFQAWTAELSRSEDPGEPSTPWPRAVDPESLGLPRDLEPPGLPTEADAEILRQCLSGADLGSFHLPARHRLQDVLITALTLALLEWRGGVDSLYLALEHHGRDGELDLSRSVGWFTAAYAVELRLAEQANSPAALGAVEQQLRALPAPASFGVQRYLRGVGGDLPEPEVLFNYLGRSHARGDLLRRRDGAHLAARAAENPRSHLLEINATLRADPRGELLELDWIFCRTVHRRGTIEKVSASFESRLRDLLGNIVPAESTEAARAIPAAESSSAPDAFPDADLDADELAHLFGELE